MTRLRIALAAVLLAACGEDYDPCSPGDDGVGAGGPDTQVTVGVGAGGGDWGADGSHGYSRDSNGEVCACDARDAELRGCVTDPPEGDCDPQVGWNVMTGECANGAADDDPAPVLPATSHICGEVFWCCANIVHVTWSPWSPGGTYPKHTRHDYKDSPVCNRATRHEAYHQWLAQVMAIYPGIIRSKIPPAGEIAGQELWYLTGSNCFDRPGQVVWCQDYPADR